MEALHTPTPEAIGLELERILASKPFLNANRSQSLLRYVVDGSLKTGDDAPKEYAIAVEVFGRDSSYDPAVDATVRVEAGRLRSRLRAYYADAGRNDSLIIEIPRGAYRATFSNRVCSGDVTHVPEAERVATHGGRKLIALGFVLSALFLMTGWVLERSIGKHTSNNLAPTTGPNPPSLSHLRIVPLTNLIGSVGYLSFSPDAKQIAFIWDGENPLRGDVYVQLVGGERPLRLTHTRSGYANSPAWSPDGSEIAFGRCDDSGGAVYVVPALGGTERKITEVACPYGDAGPYNWTSDGKSLVFADRCFPDAPLAIVVYSMETGMKKCLTSPPSGVDEGDNRPVLSPDQATVAFTRSTSTAVDDIYTVPLGGGNPLRLTSDNKTIEGYMWTPDGHFITFTSSRSGLPHTWRIPAAGGAIQTESTYPEIGALSRDGSRLAYLGPDFNTSVLWRADLSGEGGTVLGMRQLLPESAHDYAPQPSPDGQQIVFESERSGSDEIWKCNKDGSNPIRLTSLGGHAGTPRWSPDGHWIAFDYRPTEHSQIFVIDELGRNLHSTTSGNFENIVPSWSRDGKAVYFGSNRTGAWQIWRLDLESSRETQMTHHGGFTGFESYDRKTFYFSKSNGGGIWAVPVAGGEERRVTKAPHLGYWGEFAVTEHGLYLIDSDAEHGPSVMYYNAQTHRLTSVFTLKNGAQHAIPWQANLGASRDGKTVLFVMGTSKSSIVMAENFH
jgi:Tol biopolymer transport system component